VVVICESKPEISTIVEAGLFLIHDSASGPIDFSGPRCIFPFRSSGFHEPAYFGASARLRASARPRVLIVSPSLAYYYYYSSILRGIASRFQNFAAKVEVARRKRVAISTRSQLHACCQVEQRRDATLVEMRREVRAVCDRGAANVMNNDSNYVIQVEHKAPVKDGNLTIQYTKKTREFRSVQETDQPDLHLRSV
jgi:hypothetical protein